jgi:acetyl esterase/lipase
MIKETPMNLNDRVDPELRAGLDFFPPDLLDLNDIPRTRTRFDKLFATLPATAEEGVVSEDRRIPGPPGEPDMRVRVYQPNPRAAILPALLWIHGGGYVLGDVEGDDSSARHLAKAVDCVVVSVDYRLAPEHPFPAPVEDCYAALTWLAGKAGQLGVNPDRLAIGGGSAGGGLTAGLALLARDRGKVRVCFQLLIYPMIDDRNLTASSRAITDPRVWNRQSNLLGWRAYLGREPGGEGVSPYAAASRAVDLAGLPPVYLPVGTLDLFLDENIDYAQRLIQAGNAVELHVYEGAYHGFYLIAPEADVSRRCTSGYEAALRRALHG